MLLVLCPTQEQGLPCTNHGHLELIIVRPQSINQSINQIKLRSDSTWPSGAPAAQDGFCSGVAFGAIAVDTLAPVGLLAGAGLSSLRKEGSG